MATLCDLCLGAETHALRPADVPQLESAVDTVVDARPDVLLLDIEMPGRSGLDLAETLRRQEDPPAASPSERERDVLRTSQTYDTIAEIAAELHLSVSTVSNYITDAVAKASSRNRIQAIRVTRDNGWL